MVVSEGRYALRRDLICFFDIGHIALHNVCGYLNCCLSLVYLKAVFATTF